MTDTMGVAVSVLTKDVRVVLDQNMTSATLQALQDIDTLSLEELIVSKLPDAARLVELNAAHELLGEGTIKSPYKLIVGETDPTYLVKDGSFTYSNPSVTVKYGELIIPDDYLRLVSLHVNGLPLGATEAIKENDPRCARLYSRYPGIRGTWQKPVVVIAHDENGNQVFRIFPHGDNKRVITYAYVPMPEIKKDSEENDVIDICPKLQPAITYYAAFLVASVVEYNTATPLLATAKDLAGIVA